MTNTKNASADKNIARSGGGTIKVFPQAAKTSVATHKLKAATASRVPVACVLIAEEIFPCIR